MCQVDCSDVCSKCNYAPTWFTFTTSIKSVLEGIYQPSSDSESNDIYIVIGEGTIKFTSNGLLNHLVIYLRQHMSYMCIHKKFGTILYRKGGDLLISLSWAPEYEEVDQPTPLPTENLF